MPTLHVALRDGFRDHSVQILVNGTEVFNQDGVTTDLTISRAAGFEAPTEGESVNVEVRADPGGAQGSTQVNTVETSYLEVYLDGSSVRFQSSSQPFRFM
jgi:hypothetical protein